MSTKEQLSYHFSDIEEGDEADIEGLSKGYARLKSQRNSQDHR